MHCLDVQPVAIEGTKARLHGCRDLERAILDQRVHYHCQSFTTFPAPLGNKDYLAKAVVYNLGYLPNGDKSITTRTEDTLESLNNVVREGGILAPQGLLSIMCYTGHKEGQREAQAVQDYMQELDMNKWRVFAHVPVNRPGSPLLITAARL